MKAANADAALEMSRARMRAWFEEHERPFPMRKRSHRTAWIFTIGLLSAATLFTTHAPVMQALANIQSVFGA